MRVKSHDILMKKNSRDPSVQPSIPYGGHNGTMIRPRKVVKVNKQTIPARDPKLWGSGRIMYDDGDGDDDDDKWNN